MDANQSSSVSHGCRSVSLRSASSTAVPQVTFEYVHSKGIILQRMICGRRRCRGTDRCRDGDACVERTRSFEPWWKHIIRTSYMLIAESLFASEVDVDVMLCMCLFPTTRGGRVIPRSWHTYLHRWRVSSVVSRVFRLSALVTCSTIVYALRRIGADG